jgi:hypothetical protein
MAKGFCFPQTVDSIWLGGLDSNQDSQIQSLESYQLDDLPISDLRCFYYAMRVSARPNGHTRFWRRIYGWER